MVKTPSKKGDATSGAAFDIHNPTSTRGFYMIAELELDLEHALTPGAGLDADDLEFHEHAARWLQADMTKAGGSCWPLPICWYLGLEDDLLGPRVPDMDTPLARPRLFRTRLLIPGGECLLCLQFVTTDHRNFVTTALQRPITLRASVDHHVYDGEIRHGCCDMASAFVRLAAPGHEDVARAIVTALDTIRDDWEARIALYPRSIKCFACRHPLRDPVSKTLGIGPECSKEFGIPHTQEAARLVEARRAEILNQWQEVK